VLDVGGTDVLQKALEYPLAGLGIAYDFLLALQEDEIIYYSGTPLLALTVISWFLHTSRRSRTRGKPFALAPAR
jgi:hypothetical protein